MVTYHFYAGHAEKYGLPESVLLYNLVFWLRKNKAEGRNTHDERTWTYNTAQGLAAQFSFWSVHQIRRYVDSLRDQGVILTGNYSEDRRDRSLWIALVDESMLMFDTPPPPPAPPARNSAVSPEPEKLPEKLPVKPGETESRDAFGKSAKCNLQNREMDVANLPNASRGNAKTYKETDSNRSYKNKQSSTLNVVGDVDKSNKGGESPPGNSPGDPPDTPSPTMSSASLRAEAVAEIIELTGDDRSRKRFAQLHDIAVKERALGLWSDALQATEMRLANAKKPKLGKPGAYFCSVLVSLLEDRGVIVPPAGSAEERGSVRSLIGESLGLTNGKNGT